MTSAGSCLPANSSSYTEQGGRPFSISLSIVQPNPAAVHVQAGSVGSFGLLQTPGGKNAGRSMLVFSSNRAYFFALVNKQLPLPASPASQDTRDLPPGGQTHAFARTV